MDASTLQALNGARIDGGLYGSITDFARDTGWLNGPAEAWSTYGVLVCGLLLLLGWWLARRRDAATMAAALAAFAAVALAYLVDSGIKTLVAEPRPCRALPHAFLVESCPAPDDYAFPSNHSTVAFATFAALLLVDRRLAAVAALAALLMAASRVYVGAHYPHDVLAGALVGTAVALPVVLAARHYGAPLVTRLRAGRLSWLVGNPQGRGELRETEG